MIIKNNYFYFVFIATLTTLLTFVLSNFIQTDALYVQNLSEKYSQEIIAEILNIRHQWSWLVYIFIPVLLYLSTSLITLIIQLVIFLYYINDNTHKVEYKDTWGIVLMAQWSTLVGIFVKVFWFGFYHTQFTMDELQSFSPLSLINLFE